MINLEILQPMDGTDLLSDLADRRFLNPGTLRLAEGRKTPRWLPQAPGCLYAGSGGDLYDGGGDAPLKVGDLAEAVLGRHLLARFATDRHAGFIFATGEARTLAACLHDDTELDLPAAKAQRLIESGQRVYLTRDVLTYALLEAVRLVGRGNARAAGAGGPWTMRRLFGNVT